MREHLSSQQQTITDIFPSFQKHAGSLRSNMTISSSQHEVRLKTLKNRLPLRLLLSQETQTYCSILSFHKFSVTDKLFE